MYIKWGENSIIIYLIHVLFLDILKTFMISRFGIYWLYWRKWMFPVVILLTALLVQFYRWTYGNGFMRSYFQSFRVYGRKLAPQKSPKNSKNTKKYIEILHKKNEQTFV